MIAALVLVFVFAALMFLVLAFSAEQRMLRARTFIAESHARRGRDRALTVALAMFSVVAVLALAAVIL